jgi:hypothetical protein
MKPKWKKAESGGWQNVEVDANLWCPCNNEDTLQFSCYGDTSYYICPNCHKEYRMIVRVTIQERIKYD